jgi:uncharacterized delta-60 repeat protein
MNYFTAPIKFILFVVLFFCAAETFAAEGDLDLSFGTVGIVTTDNGDTNELVRDLAVQPDGKIIAFGYGGDNFSTSRRAVVVRYNPNGSIDSTFGTSGRVIISNVGAIGLALQPNGKIVVAGMIGTAPNRDFYVARLNSDGSFDATFNGTGAVILDLRGTNDTARAVEIQPDGKIVVGGGSARPGSDSQNEFALARLNADGTLDTSFDGDGKVFTMISAPGDDGSAVTLAIQSDGKIVAAGSVFIADAPGATRIETFATVRYNSDGSLDTTFDGDGKVTTRFVSTALFMATPSNTAASVLVQSDGKIVVVGSAGACCMPIPSSQIAVVRYNADGSLDASFATDGKALIFFPSLNFASAAAAAIQADDKIVIVGNIGDVGRGGAGIARLNPNGSLDETFSGDGRNVIVFRTGSSGQAFAVAIQADGKILLGGFIDITSGVRDFLLARFEVSGCTYSLSPSSLITSSAGGTFNFTVTTQQGCSDTVRSNDPFITIITKAIGENPEVIFLSITYSVAANTGGTRTGTISVGNQNFAVIQAGVKSRKRVRFF